MIALYDIIHKGERVYVGITNRPKTRMKIHVFTGVIPRDASMRVVRWYESRGLAHVAERDRIKKYLPPLNIAHIPKPPVDRAEKKRQHDYAAWEALAAKFKASHAEAMRRFDEAVRAQCKQWKKDGMTVREIRDRVKSEFKITLSQQTVWKYVKR